MQLHSKTFHFRYGRVKVYRLLIVSLPFLKLLSNQKNAYPFMTNNKKK